MAPVVKGAIAVCGAAFLLFAFYRRAKGGFQHDWFFARKAWARAMRWTIVGIAAVLALALVLQSGALAEVGLGFGALALLVEFIFWSDAFTFGPRD